MVPPGMGAEPENPERSDGFAGLVGIEYLEHTDDVVRARVEVTDRVRQPYGIVHGGVHATIAETICSYATAIGVGTEGKIAMGMSNSTTFLRPISDGHVNAAARTRHRGRTTWVWDVEITDDQDRLCALVRMTVAVRDPQPR
jgi:1,4-dihydroxy-2-naphthoyl-CoA hydrolase